MGHLISTGFVTKGHEFNFEYLDSDDQKKCLMVCKCGWKIAIESFQHTWSIIEVKVRVKSHLANHGIDSFHPAAIFDLSDRT